MTIWLDEAVYCVPNAAVPENPRLIVTGAVAGGFGALGSGLAWTGVIGEYSLPAAILNGLGAFGWNVGIAGTFLDATTGIASAATPCYTPAP